MFHIYGFYTQNSRKALYVAQESGADFEFHFVDLGKGEHATPEFRAKTPAGKVPLLEHDGRYLFESGAICRYIANAIDSPLYPADKMERALVDQWMDYFSNQPGRAMTTLFYEQIIKPRFGLGDPDTARMEDAIKLATSGLKAVERGLENRDYLANDRLSIADLYAYAYMEQHREIGFPMDPFGRVSAWFERVDRRDSIAKARSLLPKPA